MKTQPDSKLCAVCGLSDVRALVTTRLATGREVVVCGTHETVHRRANSTATTLEELVEQTSDRRENSRRSDARLSIDELGAQLTAAFSGERRGTERRRDQT